MKSPINFYYFITFYLFLLTQIMDGQNMSNEEERINLTIKRERKQGERLTQFAQLESQFILTPDNLAIVQLPFDQLQKKLQTRQLSATTVLQAFVAKALSVTRDLNCITEFVPSMWHCAEELDKLPQVKGPLHGIPVAIKDDHGIAGMDSTLGLSLNLYQPVQNNSVVVQILMDAGAVPFCKTNLPQTTFSYSSDNPIFGTTLNHLNKKLSPGGSSSGTASLVGAGGAPFGTGSDIGGSVRIPAHFSGISTLTPTVGRVSSKGIRAGITGVAGVAGVSGILAPSAKTVTTIFRIMTQNSVQNKYDPLLPPLSFNDEIYESKKPLRIGYYTSIPFFPALGDTPKTIFRAKEALEFLGHEVIPFDLPDTYHLMEVFNTLTGADGGNQNFDRLKNDLVSIAGVKFTCGRMDGITFFENTKRSPCTPRGRRDVRGNSEGQRSQVLWDYLVEQGRIKYDFLERMQTLNLDLLLTPVLPFPATPIEDTDILLTSFVYTAIYNLMQFPAGAVPFGHESLLLVDQYDDEDDFYLKLAKEGIRHALNMPIGVQIVGKPWNEELVLRVMTELENYRKDNLTK